MSLFGQYIKERENKEIIETDQGFATYFYLNDGVYIENIYVAPDYRHLKGASKLADQIAELAKAKGYSKMYGSVAPSTNNSTDSLKVLLGYGFQLQSAEHNFISFVKEI